MSWRQFANSVSRKTNENIPAQHNAAENQPYYPKATFPETKGIYAGSVMIEEVGWTRSSDRHQVNPNQEDNPNENGQTFVVLHRRVPHKYHNFFLSLFLYFFLFNIQPTQTTLGSDA